MLRIKTYHFVIAFFLITLIISIGGNTLFNDIPAPQKSEELENLNTKSFIHITHQDSLSAVLLYDDNSDSYKKMEYLISISRSGSNLKFYKMNVEDYPLNYQISGVPTVLFLKHGQEVSRIMGFVSESNLRMIIKRIENF